MSHVVLNIFGVNAFDSIFAKNRMAIEVMRHFEKCIANWASKACEENVDVIDLNNVVDVS